MNIAAQFLFDAKTFYLATNEGGQPRVRPFGAVAEFYGKTYIATNNKKEVFEQILKNTQDEISAIYKGRWIRLAGELAVDSRQEAREAMIETNPALKNMYKADDGIFEVLYFTEGTASICSFNGETEEVTL